MTRTSWGMTLMELTIALVITGLMAAVGAAAFGMIVDRRDDLVQATADTERSAALRATIHSWLVSGEVLISSGALPQAGARAGGPAGTFPMQSTQPATTGSTTSGVTAAAAIGDELDFTTMAPNPADAPQARMRLFIDGDASTPETGLTLEYQASTQTPLQRMELDSTVDSMVVEFLDARTNLWYPASEAATIQPRALRLTLLSTTTPLPGILTLPMIVPIGQQAARPGG